MIMRRFLALVTLLAVSAASTLYGQLIPAASVIDWTPGTATGVPGGIPTNRTMYVNALTGELGGGGTYGGTLAAGNGSTDDTAALQAMIDACPTGKYVYLPAATYRVSGALYVNPSNGSGDNNITIRGDGDTTIIQSEASTAISIGPSGGFVVPDGTNSADLAVTAGLSKGSTQLTVGDTSDLSEGKLVRIQVNKDPDSPDVSVNGYSWLVAQIVRVTSVDSATQFSFSPALYSDYGAGTIDVRIRVPAAQVEGIGIEDMKINLENSSNGQVAVEISQGYGCWIKGVRATNVTNYGLRITLSLKCELRRSTVDPRDGSGTSGGAINIDNASATLVEDNVIIGDWIYSFMQTYSSSGNVFSRNFADSVHTFNTNHDPQPMFTLVEGNVILSAIISDGYFGGERYPTYFNNYSAGITLHRFIRDANVIGNVNETSADLTGYPNFSNNGYSGFATYYPGDQSDPWADFQITGSRATYTAGTASSWSVNGDHSVGDTTIAIDGGTGTFAMGDRVTFSGSSYTYWVQSYAAGVLTINEGENQYTGSPGLREAISDNATVTRTDVITPSGASGYLVNNTGGYAAGTTSIVLDGGTGTIKAGEVVSFNNDTGGYRYDVVSFDGTTLVIGKAHTAPASAGLINSVADNEGVTVSQDYGLISYASGSIASFDGFYNIYPNLNWGAGGETAQRYRVPVANSTHFVVMKDQAGYPNRIALPSIGTSFSEIGPGSGGYQEIDLGVAATRTRRGNRYLDDGHFDSLEGETLPQSLAYGSSRPQWLDDAETELGATFNLQPFDPVTPKTPSASDIPAGFRYYLLIDPAFTSASINALGTELSVGVNKPVEIGAGGSGGLTLSGSVTLTFNRIEGSTVIFTTSRTIGEGELFTVSYTNPGNGIQATSNGNDLPNFSAQTVTNASSVTSGVIHYGPDFATMTSDYVYPDSSYIIFSKVVPAKGNAVAIRWYTQDNIFNAAVRVVLCELDGTVIASSSANGTVTGLERWQSLPLTSTAVDGVSTYLAGVQFLGNGDPILRQLTDQPANTSYIGTHAFASAFPGTISVLSGESKEFAVQLRVIPDPPVYTPGKLRTLRR